MNKKDYLDLLRYYLKDLPRLVVDDIVYDYEEHFNIGMAMGKSEEEITKELGYPDDVAKEYLKGDFSKKKETFTNLEDEIYQEEKKSILPWIIGAILLAPIVVPLGFAFLAFIFGIFAAIAVSGIGFFFGGLSVIISMFPGFGSLVGLSVTNPITKIFLGIAMTCLGIVFIYLGGMFLKLVFNLSKKLWIIMKWKWVRK
ncbi:MAG: DUF1700 domain-containing protein [Bacillota bacterium]|nr:DUF1700 domain-containing protein [Bacillota bacterium]